MAANPSPAIVLYLFPRKKVSRRESHREMTPFGNLAILDRTSAISKFGAWLDPERHGGGSAR